MRGSWNVFTLFLLFIMASSTFAKPTGQSIEGEWYIMDHKNQRPSVLLRIKQAAQKGTYGAVFLKVFDKKTGHPLTWCKDCAKKYKKAKVKGMAFIRGLVYTRKRYKQGRILDPRNGRWYHVMAKLIDKGKRLKVRAYALFPLLGKTEVFVRK